MNWFQKFPIFWEKKMNNFLYYSKNNGNFPCLVRGELYFPEPTDPLREPLWQEASCASLTLKKLMDFPAVPTWSNQVQRKGPYGQAGETLP